MHDTRSMLHITPVAAKVLALIGKHSPVCLLDIPRKGGATYYSMQRMQAYLNAGRGVVRLTCTPSGELVGTAHFRDLQAAFTLPGLHMLTATQMPQFHTILVNNLVRWVLPEEALASARATGEEDIAHIPALLERIIMIARSSHARLEVVIHDYFPVCPNFTLLNDAAQETYCRVPGYAECTACMRQDFMQKAFGAHFSLAAWRSAWAAFLAEADLVLFPSETARTIVTRVFPADDARFSVVPHVPLFLTTERLRLPGKEYPMHIVVAGQITIPKGAAIVHHLAQLLPQCAPQARLTIAGTFAAPGMCLPDNVTVTGPYEKEQLARLLQECKATVGLLPSVWPETFNYVAQELMAAGLPLVCFDLGAPAERIAAWEHGKIARSVSAEAALQALLALDAQRV